MKKLLVALGSALVMISFQVQAEEVELKQAPLRWKQAALSDGGELYRELCAACHGLSGTGDGPAAGALKKGVPDLTQLANANGGEFPFDWVKDAIAGEDRVVSHGTVDMPIWGQAFENIRPDWKQQRREKFAEQRIYNITEYLASIQVE